MRTMNGDIEDVVTKNVEAEVLDKHMAAMRFSRRDAAQPGSCSEKQLSAAALSAVVSSRERCATQAEAAEETAAMMEMSHRPRDGGGGGPLPGGVRDAHGRVGRETR